MIDLATLKKSLGVSFDEPSLLEQALIHSSYINENPGGVVPTSNERLEFLGDAVLSLVISEKLYQDFPQFTEGEMSKSRSVLVRRDTLAKVASAIGLGNYFYLGKGEEESGGRHKPANLAGALEAVIAAIFLDQGVTAARDAILRLFDEELEQVGRHGGGVDYKSQLQEFIQAGQQLPPDYHVVEAVGPDHDKKFTVEVKAGDIVLGRGLGKSKKIAETEAARSALQQISTDFTQ